MELISVIVIIATFFISSFIGSMVGGGGLITVPVLIFAGLSPHLALGTAKIGGFGNTSGASLGYAHKRKIDYETAWVFMIFAVIGGILGTFTVLSIPEEIIKKLIAVVMIIMSIFLLVKRDFGIETKQVKRSKTLLSLFGLASGFFAGFYGPGVGIINRFVLSSVFAYAMVNSAALSTFANSATNLASLLIFWINGAVYVSLIIPIFLAAFIGGFTGSRYAVKVGNENLKKILVTTSLVMAFALLIF